MKTQKHFLQICLVVLIFLFTSSAFAQNQVRITLHQPPPNQLSSKDLWNITAENTTGSPLEIYFEGYGDEQSKGRIVDGRSQVLTLPVGKSNFNYEKFKTGNVKWFSTEYENFIIRTGTVPAGTYTTCVTAYSTDGDIVGIEKCMTQVISRGFEGEITLITPSDGENIDPSSPITFSWSPLSSGRPYKIKIVEIIGDQSPEVAILRNKAFFEKENIRTTSFQLSPLGISDQAVKKYAWKVSSGDNSSDVYTFMINNKMIRNSSLVKLQKNDLTQISIRLISKYLTVITFLESKDIYKDGISKEEFAENNLYPFEFKNITKELKDFNYTIWSFHKNNFTADQVYNKENGSTLLNLVNPTYNQFKDKTFNRDSIELFFFYGKDLSNKDDLLRLPPKPKWFNYVRKFVDFLDDLLTIKAPNNGLDNDTKVPIKVSLLAKYHKVISFLETKENFYNTKNESEFIEGLLKTTGSTNHPEYLKRYLNSIYSLHRNKLTNDQVYDNEDGSNFVIMYNDAIARFKPGMDIDKFALAFIGSNKGNDIPRIWWLNLIRKIIDFIDDNWEEA